MRFKGLIFLFLLVLLIQSLLGFAIYYNLPSWSDRGTFGDMFGGINTLFSGLAFAGIIFTIFQQHKELKLQSKELQLQRKELELTRNELRDAANAQAEQVKQMLRAATITGISAKVQCFSTLSAGKREIPGKGQSLVELGASIDKLDELLKDV